MFSYSALKGATSHYLHIYESIHQFAPATMVSACESDSNREVIFSSRRGSDLVAETAIMRLGVDMRAAIIGLDVVAKILGLIIHFNSVDEFFYGLVHLSLRFCHQT